jgi:hypothetical protein
MEAGGIGPGNAGALKGDQEMKMRVLRADLARRYTQRGGFSDRR